MKDALYSLLRKIKRYSISVETVLIMQLKATQRAKKKPKNK